MHDAYTPIVFYHQSHRLRALMVDNQPWFVAHDFARLIGHPNSLPLLQALEPHEQQSLRLGYTHDFHEEVTAISDISAYKVLFQFGGPVHGEVGRWLSEVLVPTLHDYHRVPDAAPCRDVLSYEGGRIGVVRWQGEVWVAWRYLPVFMTSGKEVSE
ncbi:phage antirepressor [Pseudomonas taiwanensis]|uniref:BRO-N domain-containing protein n=1 Tax=Pseudomonas taiwanensis TaxID=470150 RepID=UPI0015BB76E7|nr:phage antirepressor [Pseudomonas taiwanensis]NWL80507.1 phage antirepressor [Pseudomonas taiwanensis]